MHFKKRGQQQIAWAAMVGFVDMFGIRSNLNIGWATERALLYFKERLLDVRIAGIEPSDELRRISYRKSLGKEGLHDGGAQSLKFVSGEFDFVCEFAALHHNPRPELA
jgi:hypothetical protein